MAYYDSFFDKAGLRDWCDAGKTSDGPVSMADLLARAGVKKEESGFELPFPSLDELHKACASIGQSRDVTKGVEDGFLAIKGALRFVLDPITQPLSWLLEFALSTIEATPWWIMFPVLALVVYVASKSWKLVAFVPVSYTHLTLPTIYSV